MATDFDALLANKTRYTGRWFSPDSFVNRKLPDDAPIDPDSVSYVDRLANRTMPTRIQEPGLINVPGLVQFSWWYSTYVVWVVDRDDPESYTLEDFTLDRTDAELSGMGGLPEAFRNVPVPVDARPCPHYTSPPNGPGHDNIMVIVDPATDRYWEAWHVCKVEDDGAHTRSQKFTTNVPQERLDLPGWHIGYGGAMKNMSHGAGYFDAGAWDGGGRGWGASGGKICIPTGMITRTEAVEAKRNSTPIRHILGFGCSVPSWRTFRWPAQSTDGASSDQYAPQYGMIYRFPPDYDVDSITADPFITEVMRAMRDYGLIIREYSGACTFYCECGNTTAGEVPLHQTSPTGAPGTYTNEPGYGINLFRDDVWLGEDNITGPNHDGVFAGYPTTIGNVIPWLDLEVLDASYRPTTPVKSRLILGTA